MRFFAPNIDKLKASRDFEGLVKAFWHYHKKNNSADAQVVIAALKDLAFAPWDTVRSSAVDALTNIAVSAVPNPPREIIDILANITVTEVATSLSLRIRAIEGLGKINDAHAIATLIPLLENDTTAWAASKALEAAVSAGTAGEEVRRALKQYQNRMNARHAEQMQQPWAVRAREKVAREEERAKQEAVAAREQARVRSCVDYLSKPKRDVQQQELEKRMRELGKIGSSQHAALILEVLARYGGVYDRDALVSIGLAARDALTALLKRVGSHIPEEDLQAIARRDGVYRSTRVMGAGMEMEDGPSERVVDFSTVQELAQKELERRKT
ncbi:MAG: hypothetical protein JW910_02080 [Anaerolineae bacterium]|nr:hypothetical protein [Anaerolineae bacterium]